MAIAHTGELKRSIGIFKAYLKKIGFWVITQKPLIKTEI
jgi:hypothetical protein